MVYMNYANFGHSHLNILLLTYTTDERE